MGSCTSRKEAALYVGWYEDAEWNEDGRDTHLLDRMALTSSRMNCDASHGGRCTATDAAESIEN